MSIVNHDIASYIASYLCSHKSYYKYIPLCTVGCYVYNNPTACYLCFRPKGGGNDPAAPVLAGSVFLKVK